jgi:hypothetical protein
MAIPIIVPDIGLSKKIMRLPSLIINAWRIEVSAKGPSTIANTAGAKG